MVVKPNAGSLSKHVTCNIQNEVGLREAVRIARIVSREFVVEEFIEGDVYRITVVNGAVVAACLREAPNVIGDGVSTVQRLIDIKNRDPRRGMIHQKNFTLHLIVVTARTHELLSTQGEGLESVPLKGKKVYLHDKVVLACGADIHDVTDMLHPDNKALFENAAKLCRASLVGIDFIAKDISKSFCEQKCAIIEANSLPYIDMHHYPVTGKERNVAGEILDLYLAS